MEDIIYLHSTKTHSDIYEKHNLKKKLNYKIIILFYMNGEDVIKNSFILNIP